MDLPDLRAVISLPDLAGEGRKEGFGATIGGATGVILRALTARVPGRRYSSVPPA